MTALDLRAIARALGGEVSGQRVLAPGPQHSPKDRSLCVSLAPAMPSSFLVHSFAGDDPIQCKDYVRARLGLPSWQPGDEQDRRVHLSRIKDWDRTIANSQANLRERTEDDLLRIKRAQALWNEAADPRGTMAVQYLMARALDLPDNLAGAMLRFHRAALGETKTPRKPSASRPCSRHSAQSTATTSSPSTASASISRSAGRRRIAACSALSIVPR